MRCTDLTVGIESSCAVSGRALNLNVDSSMTFRVEGSDAGPYVFSPSVDWNTFSEPNIIHAY